MFEGPIEVGRRKQVLTNVFVMSRSSNMNPQNEVIEVPPDAARVGIPSLQCLAAAAMLKVPTKTHRVQWVHNKKHTVLRQMGFFAVERTRRNRQFWDQGRTLLVHPHRIPDLVLEQVWLRTGPGTSAYYIGVVYAAPVFTTGRILLLIEYPFGSSDCHDWHYDMGVDNTRKVYFDIDAVPLNQVHWRFNVPNNDIENRYVPKSVFEPERWEVPHYRLATQNVGARDGRLDFIDRGPTPPPPPPLRRSTRKRLKPSPSGS